MNSKILLTILVLVVIGGIALFAWDRPDDDDRAADTDDYRPGNLLGNSTGNQNNATTSRQETQYTKTRVQEGNRFVTTVNYTSNGFEPAIVMVNKGETVRFVNKSNTTMRIAPNLIEGVTAYPGFDQEKSVARNGTYEIMFTEPGVWGYHNLNVSPWAVGVVVVKY